MPHVRAPAVAGSFYPALPDRLGDTVDALLASADDKTPDGLCALGVPHAGYMYSGAVAAAAYAALRRVRGIRSVLLLGPSHYVAFRGIAWTDADRFGTPLGDVAVDGALLEAIAGARNVQRLDAAHLREHSLEVQLPFLQRVLPGTPVLPLVVGDATPEEVADVIAAAWSPDVFPIVSTDLSHYLRYQDAVATDRETATAILALAPSIDHDHACGAAPLNGLLLAARRRGLSAAVLDLRNSGDTTGERAAVVGYAAIGFYRRERRS